MFSVVPNSMVDEQTGSMFTWLNTHLRNHQQVKTLVRMVQIQKWYKYDTLVSVHCRIVIASNYLTFIPGTTPKKKPTVKWRDMSSTIYGSKKRKRTMDKKYEDSDVEDNFSDDQATDTRTPTQRTIGTVKHADFQGETCDVSDTIDLDSEDLRERFNGQEQS